MHSGKLYPQFQFQARKMAIATLIYALNKGRSQAYDQNATQQLAPR
nr:hypothetical protein [Nostoc sp. ChiSLP03a]MDZ8211565.1 hypothetical protein [Nostoc sp. ChiSLP03a]